ncbi:MAG TPA: S1C family serine protease [Patescibacteria group bacterium]|nr:S1C family serine protease [Patescibacteria group bacterium]
MSKNILKIVAVFIIGTVGGIFADQIFWPYFIEKPFFYEYRLEKNPVYLTESKEIIIQENTALVEAVEKAEKTVVAVRTKTKAGQVLEGSGLVVTSDGLMVTLADLVPQGSDFSFFIGNSPVLFQVLKRDLAENLALVKISDAVLTTTSFARLDKLKKGERVFLIGSVFGEEDKSSSLSFAAARMVNEGIVKSFDENLIRTSMLEDGSMAGSPLFNIEGDVLGINTVDSQGNVSAIPIAKIKKFIGM